MSEIESQIAKIQLGNPRQTSSYVFVEAEKATGSNAELYVIAELPLLNPAAAEACEQICNAIASSLKRTYRMADNPGNFENAISQINDELGKLASLGQVHWINKLNCVIGVKEQNNFHIASCGKMFAYLYRDDEFTDISCSTSASHPLKTFENYASGRIKLGDIIILSTGQLFNYVSIDRIKLILAENEFLTASQIIVQLLKDNAGPDTAFGSILNLQIEPGQAIEEQVDLENFIIEEQPEKLSAMAKVFAWLKNSVNFSKPKRIPQISLPKFNAQTATNLKNHAQALASTGRGVWSALGRGVTAGRNTLRPQNFKNYSPEKKFFIISVLILFFACILTLGVAMRIKNTREQNSAVAAELKQAQTLLNNAQTSLLYKDDNSAGDYLNQAQNKIPAKNKISSENQSLYQAVNSQFEDLEKKIIKQTEAQVTNLGVLANASYLIKLPNFVAVQSGSNLISYNKTSGKIEDGILTSADSIKAAVSVAGTKAAIFNGAALKLWDSSNGALGQPFSSNLPAQSDFGGLAFYSTNSKVYVADKKLQQITSFVVAAGTFSKPVASIKDSALSKTEDIAVDGAIYALVPDGIKKYQSGRLVDFKIPVLTKPFSGNGKIYTQKDYKNIYLLDIGNNRILILDKTGNLVMTLQSSQFNKLVDFQVDEPGKTIYLLNDTSLLKVAIP